CANGGSAWYGIDYW
nr:immunoglobulin heavy chain junction region [Macaca mulatta]MOV49045.1 immunoglobulin heavy chain junction region [Macaca mulatta]MOV49161.1 immunoglobulin heavy chain junction region [Macaca mulatta]MOV49307.1 immunoglobulin heavy chain junction region [Macaca mulatta]MOV49478.1 immunoglobulin heavy chain junction region [Macaca mulatta]